MEAVAVTPDDVRAGARALGLSGRPLCVHASLRSFGWVEGGARAVVDGLLAEGCTVLVPTFTDWHGALAPLHRRIPRNGWDYDRAASDWWVTDRTYTVDTTECGEAMGVIPRTIAAMPGRARGNHPLNSFCAVGPLARALVSGQAPLTVYAPLEGLIARGGAVLLMGVGLNRTTLLHVAEERAGRTLFRRWAANPGGEPIECQCGSCSTGFGKLDPVLAPIERHTAVGASAWRAFDAAALVERAAAAIRADPAITHCGRPDCERCPDAVAGGPILSDRGS